MDSPLHAMVFAEDLISIILEGNGIKFDKFLMRPHKDEIGKPRISAPIINAVNFLCNAHTDTIDSSFQKLHDELKIVSKDDIRVELSITTVYHFREGYSHIRLLQICALFVGLSERYAKKGNLHFADVAGQMLAYILNFYIYMLEFEPRSDWFELACYSQHFLRRMLLPATLKSSNSK